MLLWMIHFLQTAYGVHVPAVFSYVSTRMLCAAITTLLMTIFVGPYCIKKLYELKIGQRAVRLEDVPVLAKIHEKKKTTPTMGGALIVAALLLALLLWMDGTKLQTYLLFATTIFFGMLGGIDDYAKLKKKRSRGLSARVKFVLQCAGALAVTGVHLYASDGVMAYFLPFYKHPVVVFGGLWVAISALISLFVIVGTSNAVNLTDGLDGLAAGCVLFVAAVLALFAFFTNNIHLATYLNIIHVDGSGEVAVFLCGVFGACLGFLWYNGYPAQVFMGDLGSLTLGGILGVAAVLLRREALLALVGGVFVVETLSVILQVVGYRYWNKKRLFLCAPLHHHFECKGWPETKVVLRFWIVGLLLALVGIGSLKFQ